MVEFILIQHSGGWWKRKQKSLESATFLMISAGMENNSLYNRNEVWRQSLTSQLTFAYLNTTIEKLEKV